MINKQPEREASPIIIDSMGAFEWIWNGRVFFFLDQILHHIVNFRAFNGKKKGVEVLKEICRAWNER